MNLNLAGLQLAIQIGIDLDRPRIADAHVFAGRHRLPRPDLLQQAGRELARLSALPVPCGQPFIERSADLGRDERHDIAKRLIIVRTQIDAVNRGYQGLVPDAEQPLFHIAQDFSNEVITLETAWQAASHGTIVMARGAVYSR